MQERQLDRLAYFLDLLLETTDIRVGFCWCFFEFHDADDWVRVVGEHAHDGDGFVVEEHRRPWLEEVLVHEAHDTDVVLRPCRAAHNRMVIIDHLLKSPDPHRTPTHIINLPPLIRISIRVLHLRSTGQLTHRLGAILRGLDLADPLLILDIFFF
jgi:hypothetical protein